MTSGQVGDQGAGQVGGAHAAGGVGEVGGTHSVAGAGGGDGQVDGAGEVGGAGEIGGDLARWAVVGAGAMGSVVGAHLALAGRDVVLVDVDADHVAAIRRDGLRMRRPGGEDVVVRVAATTDPRRDLDRADVAIFLCKGWATTEAARSVAHAIPDDGWAVTIQNGLGNDHRLAEVLGAARVVPGTTTVGAVSHGPGDVGATEGTVRGSSLTQLGAPRGTEGVPDGVRAIAEAMTASGLPTEVLPSADTVIWTKVVMAASMACLTGILRRSVADVVHDRWAWALWEDMVAEILAVAEAKGVALDGPAVRAHSEATYRSVGHHVTSMAADVVAGRRTEVESLALEIARQADEVGVPVPVTRTVGRLIRALEGSYDRAL